MKQTLYILSIILLTGCFSETFNKIPCSYDFTTLQDSLKKFGIWSYSESPDGFKWKEKYDSNKVECERWTISIGIDSCNNIFYNEKYVTMLADLVFNEPKNYYIQQLKFELSQCHYGQGQRKLYYEIAKDRNTSLQLRKLPESKNAKIIKQISEGYSDKPENKFVSLLIDSLPTNPYSLALEFANRNKEYRHIELVIENINSKICKRVKFSYGFE